ncbi:F-box associated domain containing protein [Tanacetum coccineum]
MRNSITSSSGTVHAIVSTKFVSGLVACQVSYRVGPSSDLDTGSCTRAREVVMFSNVRDECSVTGFGYDSVKDELHKHHLIFWNGSCNGLVLACAFNPYLDLIHTFFVSNLTTRDCVEFPVCWHEFSNVRDECSVTGFGYDSVKDDYKVVTISKSSLQRVNDVHVYSLRSNTWRKLSNSPYEHSSNWCGNKRKRLSGVFVNGFLHWIAGKDSDHGVIVAFSLADEKFSEVPDWKNYADILSGSDCLLVALGEKLAIFRSVKGEVWLMNEYGVKESWTKIVLHGFDKITNVEPVIFYNNGKLVVVTHDPMMMIYDLEQETFCKSVEISEKIYTRVKCAYVESLVSPKLG